MSFVDTVEIFIAAGDGGDGKMSFRHEKFIEKGGPDGGDGGNGADVVLVASRNQNTLSAFRYQKELTAPPGKPGGKSKKHGRSGVTMQVAVPIGTIATSESGEVLADLTIDGQKAVIAHGGRGGFGNAHFVSSRRQAPKFAEKGEPGEQRSVRLEIKLIADVGIIGLPNAGKSTLLARISNAKPQIADYAFTTLVPHLGVVDVDTTTTLLFADIPGLIEGAAEGKGLGHDFLRHVERTAVLVHLVDIYEPDLQQAYETVNTELSAYDASLTQRPQIAVLSKIEGLDQATIDETVAKLQQIVAPHTPVLAISAQSGQGLQELLFAVKQIVETNRAEQAKTQAEAELLPVLRLPEYPDSWTVERDGKVFIVRGQKVEQFALRTELTNPEALQRLRDILRRTGIVSELIRRGIEPGDLIVIGDTRFPY